MKLYLFDCVPFSLRVPLWLSVSLKDGSNLGFAGIFVYNKPLHRFYLQFNTCTKSYKERSDYGDELTLDLGSVKNWGGHPISRFHRRIFVGG